MSGPELKPCPFCGGGVTSVEGKGQVWRGVNGYSDPQWYELNHFGKLSETDDFPTCRVTMRHRTEAEAIAAWNTRTDTIPDPHAIARRALEAAADVCAERSLYLEDAIKWGGSKAYITSLKGGIIELSNTGAAIRALSNNHAKLTEIVEGK